MIASTGFSSVSLSSCRRIAEKVRSLRCWGVSSARAASAGTGSDNRSAISANSSADAAVGNNAASLRSFAAASSSRSKPAARVSWAITGCSSVSW